MWILRGGKRETVCVSQSSRCGLPRCGVEWRFRNIYPGNLRDISLAISRDGGHTFAPPVRISEDHWSLNGCPDDGPTMQVDAAGTLHIVWPTLVQGPEPAIGLFRVSTRDGVTFTRRQAIPFLGVAEARYLHP